MGRLGLAFKAFFKILSNAEVAERVEAGMSETPVLETETPKPVSEPPKPARSEALTLLEALQREARLIDFLKEDLSEYQDAQVGAAVRDVHRGCRDVMHRFFDIDATCDREEGQTFEVTAETDPAEVRLTGNVVETRPVSGTLVHSGWKARKCELPRWSGDSAHRMIIAPAEVELG